MVRFFESERAYVARMQKRRNMIKNNAELVRLIRAYRNSMNKRRPSYQGLMNRFQIEKELVKRAKYILKNLENVPSNRVLMKVLMMYPKSLNTRMPRYVLVNQPNRTKALGHAL
jgi:hypothetical protein